MSDQYPTSRDNFSPQAQCRYNLHFLLWNTLNEWKLPPGPKHVLKNNLVNPCEQLLRRPLANLGQDELCSQVSCKEQVLTLLDHNLISEGLVGQSQGQFKLLLAARNIIFFPIPHQHVIIQQIDVWSWSLAHILTMRRGGYPPNNPTNRVFISYKLNPIFRWPMKDIMICIPFPSARKDKVIYLKSKALQPWSKTLQCLEEQQPFPTLRVCWQTNTSSWHDGL